MPPKKQRRSSWLESLSPPSRLRLIVMLSVENLLTGLAGAVLAFFAGKIPISPFVTAGFSLVGLLLLSLAIIFFVLSYQIPRRPLSLTQQNRLGRAWAALALVLLWYIFGGILAAFLLDNFFGWDHLPMALAVLIGLHFIPIAETFQKPLLLAWGVLVIVLGILLNTSLSDAPLLRAQIMGVWITTLLWTLALDQLRSLHEIIQG